MSSQIDKILGYQGNKYEKTAAMIKYARYLSQKHEDDLEIPLNRVNREKITVVSISDILSGKVTYTVEKMEEK